ncbi:MAG: hypothetical protein GYB49_12090 [Alphaproteobacteria bacterium]|nr:hypothetical protein [Hyphomonas sp.]MBR9807951.1 hypothetical protein [Alphaproteobacteria bacterium]|tara:strand:- start:9161 stop:9616 length:456 start_codon:yes stop_codon:yes gene_type:complete
MLARMDPHYRPFFKHVWAFCWPWLWWNLVRLTEWRRRTGRNVFVVVDKLGNVYIQYVGDVAGAKKTYTYEPSKIRAWERLAPGMYLPDAEPVSICELSGKSCRKQIIFSGTYCTCARDPPDCPLLRLRRRRNSILITGRPSPRRPHALVTA